MKNTDGNVVISKKDIVEGGKVVGQEVNYDLAKEITVDKVTAKKGLTIGEGDKAITLAPVDTTNVNGINNQPALSMGGKSITQLADNLVKTDDTTKEQAAPKANEFEGSNAATVNDVLNSGFNLKVNGEAKDFVNAYDTVELVDGNRTDVTFENGKIKVDVDSSQLPVVYTDGAGKKVVKNAAGNWVYEADGSLVADQANIKATMQSPTGDTTTGTKLTNVAPAEISDDSKDAVNGSQLKKVADTLGLEVNDDKDGFKAPVLKALKDKKGNDVAAPTTIVGAVNGLADKVNEGFNFGASNATKGNQQLGSSLVVVASDKADGQTYVTDNLTTEYVKDADGNGKITISMKESPTFKEVTAEKVTAKEVVADNVTIGSVVINKDTGINAGNHKITNVTDGTIAENSKDAVNGGQLWNVEKNLANKISDVAGDLSEVRKSAITFEGNEGKSDQSLTSIFQIVGGIAKDSKVKTSSKNIKTVVTPRKENEKVGKLEIQMSENPVFNSVQFGDNGPTISSIVDANGQSAINMGGSRVTGVAPGVADTDAVNVGQLKQTAAALDKKIKKAGAGAAAAMAAAGLPQPYDPGASVVSAAIGQYGLNAGFAVGISTITDNGRWIIKGSMATDTQLNFGSNVGVGYQW
ncbi:MAG: YadA-like family protein [Alcaligenaceae bacterium]|nr:YadA-like family protein [Alcaligenaceae bacterium]